jgi:hypothetical protein
MAEHTPPGAHLTDLEAHVETYESFIKGALGLSLIAGFVLVALVSFRFGHTLNVFAGFSGLVAGFIAVTIDARMGSRWLLSVGLLVLFGLITAINVS